MFKKCKANCQANDNLYLRGNVFYYMVELPRQDGKRRYFIKSLHTKDYYEALEKAKNMKKDLDLKKKSVKELLSEAKRLMNKIDFEDCIYNIPTDDGRVITTKTKRISTKTDINVIKSLFDIISQLTTIKGLSETELGQIKDLIHVLRNYKMIYKIYN